MMIEQKIKDKDEVDAKKDAEIMKVNRQNQELQRILAEAEKMLAQISG